MLKNLFKLLGLMIVIIPSCQSNNYASSEDQYTEEIIYSGDMVKETNSYVYENGLLIAANKKIFSNNKMQSLESKENRSHRTLIGQVFITNEYKDRMISKQYYTSYDYSEEQVLITNVQSAFTYDTHKNLTDSEITTTDSTGEKYVDIYSADYKYEKGNVVELTEIFTEEHTPAPTNKNNVVTDRTSKSVYKYDEKNRVINFDYYLSMNTHEPFDLTKMESTRYIYEENNIQSICELYSETEDVERIIKTNDIYDIENNLIESEEVTYSASEKFIESTKTISMYEKNHCCVLSTIYTKHSEEGEYGERQKTTTTYLDNDPNKIIEETITSPSKSIMNKIKNEYDNKKRIIKSTKSKERTNDYKSAEIHIYKYEN